MFGPGAAVAGRVLPPHDVVGTGRAQHVQVAVAVHVGRIHGSRALEESIHGMFGPGAAVAGRVLPPRDVLGNGGRAQDVHIAVAVHVGRIHGIRAVELGVHGVFDPGAAVAGRVLPPGDLIAIAGRTQHVQVAVAVHVRRIHRIRANEGRIHGVFIGERTRRRCRGGQELPGVG